MEQYLFLIPLFPLLGFLFNFTVGVRVLGPKRGQGHGAHSGHDAHAGGADAHGAHAGARGAAAGSHDAHGAGHASPLIGLVACGAVALSFLVSLLAVLEARHAPERTLVQTLWAWLPGGAVETAGGAQAGSAPFQVNWAYQVDPLSSVMILVVTFVGLLIHIYSTGYMGHDPGYARYMSYLNLFMFAMLTLVLGANYAVLFVGWEGVGLCSYLLIGFWFEKQSASDAGKKAFIVNRIGDAGFLLGMFLIFVTFGSLDFRTVMAAAEAMPVESVGFGTLTAIGLFLFIGACGKSAQLPLYVWLPDAMEGPTPVSALIHAATMVTAGVYMVARSSVIYAHAPNALMVVALVGAFTAIGAASIGLVQNDIKRVLAYSTVSQLGYMFLACGVGAFAAGVFHLMTHAFFKALLFLGSGSVIHAMGGEQDMRRMGGLRQKLPWTHRTMLIGCIAIAGVPPLAGFFSKDEILWSAYKIGGYGQYMWAMGFVVAAMTAFYMFRLYHMTFSGSFRGTPEQERHVHESPRSMVFPLQVLALGSILAGFVGFPALLRETFHLPLPNLFELYLEPVFGPAHHALQTVFTRPVPSHAVEALLMGASIAIAAFGIVLAFVFFQRHPEYPQRIYTAWPRAYRVLYNKYYVDEIYGALFVRGAALAGGNLLWASDRYVIDGGDGQVRPGLGVNGVAWLSRDIFAAFSNFWDTFVVDGAVNLTGYILDNLSYVFRAVQNGLVQHYALVALMIVFVMIGLGHFIL
jgi:NADH-quinone oxidoreductase subunit L